MSMNRRWLALCAAAMLAVMTAPASLADELPYYAQIERGRVIFDGPGYEYSYAGAVEEDGTYTIVAEAVDDEGNMWGWLKSGRGWVLLTEPGYAGEADALITAVMADEGWQEQHYRYVQEASEYTVWLTFRAGETVRNVQFISFAVADAGMKVDQVLYTVPEMQPGTPLVTGVVFYGDMTTYGLLVTDESGCQRCYTVSISGYDGSLVVEECELIALPVSANG